MKYIILSICQNFVENKKICKIDLRDSNFTNDTNFDVKIVTFKHSKY